MSLTVRKVSAFFSASSETWKAAAADWRAVIHARQRENQTNEERRRKKKQNKNRTGVQTSVVLDGAGVLVSIKLDVSEVKNTTNHVVDGINGLWLKTHSFHGSEDLLVVGLVINALHTITTTLAGVAVIGRVCGKLELGHAGLISRPEELVEDVEGPLILSLEHDTGLLQEVVGDDSTNWVTLVVKLEVHVLSLRIQK
jgi:hypothetical protein